jgi:hypothetical protein
MLRNIRILSIALAIAALASACNEEPTREDESAALQLRSQEILSYAKSGVCTDSSTCRYIGLGSKPCGGPWKFIIYSTSLDTTRLHQMITQYNTDEDKYNRKWGLISDCSVPPPPDSVRCLNGVCVGYWNGVPRQ